MRKGLSMSRLHISAIRDQRDYIQTEELLESVQDLLYKTPVRDEDRPSSESLLQALKLGITATELNGLTQEEVDDRISRYTAEKDTAIIKYQEAREQAQKISRERKKARVQTESEAHTKAVEEQLSLIIQAVGLLGVSLSPERLKKYYKNSPNFLKIDFNALEIFSKNMTKHNGNLSQLSRDELDCLDSLSLHLQELIVGKTMRDTENPKYVITRTVPPKEWGQYTLFPLNNTREKRAIRLVKTEKAPLFSLGNTLEIIRCSRGGKQYPNLSAQIKISPSNQTITGVGPSLKSSPQKNKKGSGTESLETRYAANSDGQPTKQVLSLGDLVFHTQLKKEGS